MTAPGAAPARVVLVLGGDGRARCAATAELLTGHAGRALLLTPSPTTVHPDLDTAEGGAVEVRHDDPEARVASYLSGAEDPDDDVLAALAAGPDGPLAATLGLEYARRAAAAGWWDTVVVELDGEAAALRRLSGPATLAAYVEHRWPAHQRYASMAAGDRAETRMRAAHGLAELSAGVRDFLRTVELRPAGRGADATGALARLVLGTGTTEVAGDPASGYEFRVALPTPPVGGCTVRDGRLLVPVEALVVGVDLPPLLRRCVLDGVDHVPGRRGRARLVARFSPDPDLWPPSLVSGAAAEAAG